MTFTHTDHHPTAIRNACPCWQCRARLVAWDAEAAGWPPGIGSREIVAGKARALARRIGYSRPADFVAHALACWDALAHAPALPPAFPKD